MLERLRIVTLRCEAVAEIVQHSCVLPLELAHLSLLLLRVKRATCNRNHAAQHSTAQHSTAQHSTAQHSTAQHSTAQHSTAQHSGVHTATGAQHNVRHRIHHARYFFCACRVTSADSRTHIPTRVVRRQRRRTSSWRMRSRSCVRACRHGHSAYNRNSKP
jgi:hypothetical protein